MRQLPLFDTEPYSPQDFHAGTRLGATIPHFQRYLQRTGKSVYTVRAFTADLGLLAEYARDDPPLGSFTTEGLREFMRWLEEGRGVPCSRKSWARRATTLKVYFAWLREQGVIPIDPAQIIPQRSGPAPLAEVLLPAEVTVALEAAHALNVGPRADPRPLFLLRLLLETGIKKGETMRLRAVDFSSGEPPTLTVRYRPRPLPAGESPPDPARQPELQPRNIFRERRIPLADDFPSLLAAYLAAWPAGEGRLFNCSPRNLEYVLARIAARAGVERISFEMLRWTCALRNWRAGMAPSEIRDMLGLSVGSWQETGGKLRRLAALQGAAESARVEASNS